VPAHDDTELDDAEVGTAFRLAREGLVVVDADDADLAALRERDTALRETQWHPWAVPFHFMTKWRDVDTEPPPGIEYDEDEAVQGFVEQFGAPPAAAHHLGGDAVPLPLAAGDGELFALLRARRTTREFDPTRSLSLEQLAIVLRTVFGWQATAAHEGIVSLRKTSPSGGALHPVEAYPLVLGVDGVAPGLYHYTADEHTLEPIEQLSPADARALAVELTAGQPYFGDAGVLFLLTARFYRSYWKYRRHPRAYSVLLMDVGHLSQTLYLVCTRLGLGAFVTAAINGGTAEDRLGLDPLDEGALAICGCGVPAAGTTRLDPDFRPFTPRGST
jgi:putative peptide maturation dehydrogenase